MDPRPEAISNPPPPYEPHPLLRWLYRRFFDHLTIDKSWKQNVREAAATGVVVYVMRAVSVIDFLCLDFLTKKFALPHLRFVNDLGLWLLEPFGRGERRMRLRRAVPQDKSLREVIDTSSSALLFLRSAPTWTKPKRRGGKLDEDLLRTLIAAQRRMQAPIVLVPQTFVWSKRPTAGQSNWWDFIFGPTDFPGAVRNFAQFVINFRNGILRSGEPFDLAAFVREHPDLTDAQLADKVRYALLRRIERERTLVVGPVKKSPERVRAEILRSPRVRDELVRAAKEDDIAPHEIDKRAEAELRSLGAAPSAGIFALWSVVLERVWSRIYDGLIIDEPGIERLRALARTHQIILLPTHKSHLDYIVMSYVLYRHGMLPPLVAAGDNLNFFPLGWLLRRSGGFYIRRSFKGHALHSVLVNAYIRKMITEGYAIEFFMEGGRSRTGRILPPKLGLLSMVVDAVEKTRTKVAFIPVTIDYERVVEEGAYVQELSGGEKSKESVGGLLKTPTVLASRYGRTYVRFGRAVSLYGETFDATREPPSGTAPREDRAVDIAALASKVFRELETTTIATPTAVVAAALIANTSNQTKHVSEAALLSDAETLVARLERAHAPLAPALSRSALEQALRLLATAKLVKKIDHSIHVPPSNRLALDYYANTIIHHLLADALMATAKPLHDRGDTNAVDELVNVCRADFDLLHGQTFLTALRARVEQKDWPADAEARLCRELLRSTLEAKRLVISAHRAHAGGTIRKRDWSKLVLANETKRHSAERRESISRARIDHTMTTLRELGATTEGGEGTIRLLADDGAKQALARLDEQLATWLARDAAPTVAIPHAANAADGA